MPFLSNQIDKAGDGRIKWTQIDNCRIDNDYVETSGTIAQNYNFQQQKIKLDLLTQIRREYIYIPRNICDNVTCCSCKKSRRKKNSERKVRID